jgi:hypothetical protein
MALLLAPALLFALSANIARSQPASPSLPPARITARSLTGQFVVNGPPVDMKRLTEAKTSVRSGRILLQPSVLTVSAERVKAALLTTLDLRDEWRGRIYLNVRPPESAETNVLVHSVRFQNGWNYRVDLPQAIEREQLIRSLVAVCLEELIARRAPGRHVAAPLWLTEGLARHLDAIAIEPLVLETDALLSQELATPALARTQPPQLRVFDSQRLPDPYRIVRRQFVHREPCTFADLDATPDASWTEADWEHFRCCSQLFVGELLKMPSGQASLRTFAARLPDYLNWQLALLDAFQPHFQRPLDVEQWWSVTLVNFRGRDEHNKLSQREGLRQLERILAAPAEIRPETEAPAERTTLTMQAMIGQTEFPMHRQTVIMSIARLRALQWNVPTDLLKLIEDYRFTLDSYLSQRTKIAGGGQGTPGRLIRETVERLNLLDVVRADFQRYGITPVAATSDPAAPQP